MTSWLKLIKQVSKNQLRNSILLLNGHSVKIPPLGSTTLDVDDIRLIRDWLNRRERWQNDSIVKNYETSFSRWNGSKYAYSFMGGRVALNACIEALDLKAEDEVLLPGYTCVVVPNAFRYAGVKTVYCDIELDTYGLDVQGLKDKITSRTRAILIQHLYGLVCRDYEALIDFARRHHLWVIEDCAQSTGAEFQGVKVGNLGDCAIYSSEQSKVFTTGQGGIATTNNDDIAGKLQTYYQRASYPVSGFIEKQLYNLLIHFDQYKSPNRWWLGDFTSMKYVNKILVSTTAEEERGIRPINYGKRMPAPIAALGINQLAKIDHYNQLRRETALVWDEWCLKHGYKPATVIANSRPIYLRYPVLVEPEKKKNTWWSLKDPGVRIGVWFVSHIHPVAWEVPGCPKADVAVSRCINFPGVII